MNYGTVEKPQHLEDISRQHPDPPLLDFTTAVLGDKGQIAETVVPAWRIFRTGTELPDLLRIPKLWNRHIPYRQLAENYTLRPAASPSTVCSFHHPGPRIDPARRKSQSVSG